MKKQLIEDNMNLVYGLIHKEYSTYKSDEDIVQCGMVGLCKAAEQWDESKSSFSTYATHCIRNEIRQELRSRSKHKGVLSLDFEMDDGDGEKVTFGDCILGDEDVDYIDLSVDVSSLTSRETEVYELLITGLSWEQVANKLGIPISTVWKVIRKIRILRGQDGN